MSRAADVGKRLGSLVVVLALTACATPGPAPVKERSGSAARSATSAAISARDARDYYTVKKGDTLYSIALDHGQDPRDVAAWNGLSDANVIQIGQQLRVRPPAAAGEQAGSGDGVAIVKPVILDPGADVRRAEPAAATPAAPILKREPKAGKQPYSAEALAQLRSADDLARKGTETQVAIAAPADKIKPDAKATETRPADDKRDEGAADVNDADGLEWGWPVNGKLIRPFNEPTNKGVDIAGKPGEPVYAAANGRVTYVGSAIRGYGNLIIIQHKRGYVSAYAHNRKILVKENQSVGKGQKIAELGDSDADQPKLHFEIRRRAKPLDPLKYLPAR